MNTRITGDAPINVGVVGLGRLGSVYARYLATRISGARLPVIKFRISRGSVW
jgi:hypothetical protein